MNVAVTDTIAAIATAPGAGGIAVLRLSGPKAFEIAAAAFVPAAPTPHMVFGNGTVRDVNSLIGKTTYGYWLARPSRDQGYVSSPAAAEVIDDVVLSVYARPRSYTGEDTVEISCHGSRFIQQRILAECIDAGARIARPGEFTERAFLNGRMGLSQAEAVGDLIAAESAAAHRLARTQLSGGLRDRLSDLRTRLIDFAALIELENDFGEEDVSFADRPTLRRTVREARQHLTDLIATFETGRAIREGVNVTLAGRPNAGKSTLLNALLQEDRAIVSPIPGTTRDTVDGELDIDGVRFRITDTAGIRQASDAVEAMGIQRTMRAIEGSAVLVYVWDVVMCTPEEVAADLAEVRRPGIHVVGVANKMDLNPYAKFEHYAATGIAAEDFVPMVAAEGMNLGLLRERLYALGVGQHPAAGDVILSNRRHVQALSDAHASLERVADGFDASLSGDLLALDLRQALGHIGEVTGEVSVDDLLDSIFSTFCIGK